MGIGIGAALAGASVLGGVGSSLLNKSAQKDANKANMELAKFQWDKNLDMWKMQNAYNSPEQQMARLREAGLNPNLVYGNGSAANVSSSAPSYKAPNIEAYTGMNTGLSGAADMYMASRMNEASVANMKEQNSNLSTQRDALNQQIITEGLKQSEIQLRNAKSDFDLQLAKELRNTSISAAEANLKKVTAEIENTQSRTALTVSNTEFNELKKRYTGKQIEHMGELIKKLKQDMDFDKFDYSMKKLGVYPHDSLLQRIIGRYIGDVMDSSPEEAYSRNRKFFTAPAPRFEQALKNYNKGKR